MSNQAKTLQADPPNFALKLDYRLLTDNDDVIYADSCLYRSTAVARARAATNDAGDTGDHVLQVLGPTGWRSLGSLSTLARTVWVGFQVGHPRPDELETAVDFIWTMVRGRSRGEGHVDRGRYISVPAQFRDDAVNALNRAQQEFPGFSWTERVG